MSKKKSNGTPPNLLPVPAFDPDLLPDALRPWVTDVPIGCNALSIFRPWAQ